MNNSTVSYEVQERIYGGWFGYGPHRTEQAARKDLARMQRQYHDGAKYRLVKKTSAIEVIG